MRIRIALAGALAALLFFALSTISPAQSKRVFKVSLVSFKFEPDLITMNEGDRVVLQLTNNDEKRNHAIASAYFSTVDLTVRGDAKQGVTSDGLKYVQLEPGKSAEVEFVAMGRGQTAFICSVFDHASRGQTGAFIIWPEGYRTKP